MRVDGDRETKLTTLEHLRISGKTWIDAPGGWRKAFRPSINELWQECPRFGDILPWQCTGITQSKLGYSSF